MQQTKQTTEKKKDIAVQNQNTSLATAAQAPEQLKGLIASDVIIPQVLLMQGLSDLVANRKAGLGDIVRSTTAEKLGDLDTAVDFIPLTLPTASWVIMQKNASGKFEYRRTEPRTASNETLPWNYYGDRDGKEVGANTNGSTEWKRVKRLSLYAILPQDIAAERAEKEKAANGEFPDLSKALSPVMISFQSTSFNAGKEVITLFTQAQSFGVPAYKYIVKLSCRMEKNDQGTFYVWGVDRTKPRAVDAADLVEVERWAKIVSGGANLQVHQVDEPESSTGPTGATSVNTNIC